ncbi:TraR/DksA family transcriptional regulator [Hippea alviniae]|uniref:TraR/DksA family transcriptional regulator n=1 Tax=Hippea alviniae TaxID=1279027 RepID=UPI0003B31105|nr:TraR/DksA C4-type zinc finger protein [Hippea alviniae]
MDAATLEELKDRLLSLKKEISARIKENLQKVNSIQLKGDEGDFSSAVYSRQVIYDLIEKDRVHLREIEESLYDIEKGTYGICKRCGKEIEIERMKAKPTAKYCIECRKIIESGR